ncbi:unnamed protein product [Prorocentrum cordatum]|uniref:MMS19 nucleotide excision repair protein n=1 Tax=Prorocentrum cordatum TaxID=2364126 RepID=A0ABN9XFB7_9DINO|nr:unnamed protein product [Polarella glacialis]
MRVEGRPQPSGDCERDRFSKDEVLRAVAALLASPAAPQDQAAAASARRTADKLLCDFQRSDSAVPVCLELLAGARQLPPEAVKLLSSTVRRRLQARGAGPGDPPPAEVLRLAGAVQLESSAASGAGELLVRGAVAMWLHAGGPLPTEALLVEAAGADAAKAELALLALRALPEEANAKEVKIDSVRPQLLLEIASTATDVLQCTGRLELPRPALALSAATSWLLMSDSSVQALDELAASPLLAVAARLLAGPSGAQDSGHSSAVAAEFLEALLQKSRCAPACPEKLAHALLRLLAEVQPSSAAERTTLCGLVASATSAWCRFFVVAESPPAPAWATLLDALMAGTRWGHQFAALTMQTWVALGEHVVKVGATRAYAMVLVRAMGALRAASVYTERYEHLTAEARDEFVEYRRELRDALRLLTASAEARHALLEQLQADVASGLRGPWRPLEEAVHALSALAKAVVVSASGGPAEAQAAAVVVQVLSALAADDGPVLRCDCHRQLAATYLMCASHYMSLFLQDPGGASLAPRVLQMARASLAIQEHPAEGEGFAYPFRVKQDHVGVVCLLKICLGCAGRTLSPEAAAALRGDVRSHLSEASSSRGSSSLQPHSVLVLVQAAAVAAASWADASAGLLGDCLAIARDSGSPAQLALMGAAEVVSHAAGVQAAALAAALAPFWAFLSEAHLDAQGLAALLSRAAEALPAEALKPLAQLVAGVFTQRPDARAPLLGVTTALVHRCAREAQEPAAVTALTAELLRGVGEITWAQLDAEGRASRRLRLLADPAVRSCDEGGVDVEVVLTTAAERAAIEEWARLVHEAGRHAPAALLCQGGGGLRLALCAALSLVAAPQLDPPARALALLAQVWDEAGGVRAQAHAALDAVGVAGVEPPWPLGALAVRGTMKALMGQMPPNALGVIMPAARAVFQYGPEAAEAWVAMAVGGDGFPSPNTKEESKARLVKELMEASGDAQRFKQALKRFCGGKKKGK